MTDRRRQAIPPAQRRIGPGPVRSAAFLALGAAAVALRAATAPARHLRRRRDPARAADVFLLEPYGLGDAIALQPLVRALLGAGRRVAVGTRPAWFPVFEPHPRLALVAAEPPWADRDDRRKYRRGGARLRAFLAAIGPLARGRLGIDPRGDVRGILALYAAGCVRVETLARYFAANDCPVLPGAARRRPVDRAVPRWRLNGVFAPGLALEPPSLAHLVPPGAAPPDASPWAALVPMTPWPGKRWEGAGWRAVAAHLRRRCLRPVVLCGPGEADACRRLFDGDRAPEVRECADVAAWARALAGCRLAVAVNTGPMHVASSLGIPVVLLEGSSRQPLWAPPREPYAVVDHQRDIGCAPCHQVGDCSRCGRRCMRAITPGEVADALDGLLGRAVPLGAKDGPAPQPAPGMAGFRCLRCGACCRIPGIVRIASDEVAPIAAALGLAEREFLDRHTAVAPDRSGLVLLSRSDDSCEMLTPEGLCRIQEAKPRQCRSFPFAWRNADSRAVCAGLRALDEARERGDADA